jgi:hypothetical protein
MKIQNLHQAMLGAGWLPLDVKSHPRVYVDTSGKRYGTLEKAGVRIALSLNLCLGMERGTVMVYQSDQDQPEAILQALIVESDRRRQGHAKNSLAELTRLADSCLTHLYLEPCPLEDKPVSREGLESLYRRYGFHDISGKGIAMVRPAQTHPITTGKFHHDN